MIRRITAISLMILAALLLAGCGEDSDTKDSATKDTSAKTETSDTSDTADTNTASGAVAQTLELKNKGDEFAFDKTELTATAGAVTLKLTNDSSIPHNVALKDADGKAVGSDGELVQDGGVSQLTAELEPGTYEYYCTPHEGAGMKGTLTVS